MTSEEAYLSFDRVAESYEATRYIPPAVLEAAAQKIFVDSGTAAAGTALDVGVGTGRFSRYLCERFPCVVGVDVSPAMLRQAELLPRRPDLVRGDARALPFQAARFDAALVVHLLHLIGDWKRALQEIRRVLRPGRPLYLGSEGGKHFASRALYFQVAAEWRLNRPNLGAESLEAILTHATETGAEVSRIDGGALSWTARATVREMLDTLRGNPFSHLWHVQPDVHALLMAEVERRAAAVFPSADFLEEAAASLSLWRVQWGAA